MDFDLLSFLLGFGSASGLSYGLWRYREHIRGLQETAEGQAESAREFLRRSADARYMTDMAAYLQKQHLYGDYASLGEILIEPRLLPALIAKEPPQLDDEIPDDYSYIIPRIHEFPEFYASFYLESVPLTDVLSGDPYVAILGNPGTGKSTALVALALMAFGEISFETMQQLSNQILEKEYAGLSDKEKERRAHELEEIQARALEQLRTSQNRDELEAPRPQRAIPKITHLFPIYFHIGDIDLDLNLYGLEVDPAEPIIHAFQQYVSVITGQAAPVLMYQHLARGDCLVLIDGYEDLSESEQARLYPWMQNFIAAYGNNRIVITGPALGFDPLLQLGFAPVFMRPFPQLELEHLVQRWIEFWPTLESRKSGKKRVQAGRGVDAAVAKRLVADIRNRTPLEVTLKVIAGLLGDEREVGKRSWLERYTRDYIPEHGLPILREIATVMLDRGINLKQDQIVEIVTKQLTDEEEKPLTNIEQFTKALFNGGLMVKRAGNTYTFRHHEITAYFGAESLIHDKPQRISETARNENWHAALALATAVLDLSPAIHQKLSMPPDLLFSNLFSITRWLPETPPNARWRAEILKRLGAAMLAPTQFDALRERAAAALIASRDPNVHIMFRQAIRSGNPAIRKLGCLGLGALGATDALQDLRPMLVDDDRDVQLAAGMGLGAIGTEAALEVMVQGLLEGEEPLRQIVAESMGGIPGDGYNILRDAIEHQDMAVRRAAVFGLARVQKDWALVALYHTMLNDSEWYVRSAAEYLFTQVRETDHEGPHLPPPPDQLQWLANWAAKAGLAVPQGEKALQLVVRALQDTEPAIRILAAHTLGNLGIINTVKPLYAALLDKDAKVRTAAYDALSTLQRRITQPLPSIA